MEDRTEWRESGNRRREVADLLVLLRPAEMLQSQSRLCQNEKKQSHLSRLPDREMGESQGELEPYLSDKEGD